MKSKLLACLLACLATPLHAIPLLWSQTVNVGADQQDYATRMARDADGNVIAAGYTSVGINGQADILITKYSSDGTQLWQRIFQGRTNGNDYAGGVGCDAAGNIYVVGTSSIGDNHAEIVLLKYEPNGDLAWQRFEATGLPGSWAGGNVLAVDAAGNTAFPSSRKFPIPSFDWQVIYVVSYDAAGQRRWAQQGFSEVDFPSGWSDTSVRDITFGPDGTVYICGEWRSSQSVQDSIPVAGWGAISSNGALLWAIKRHTLPGTNIWVSHANDIGLAPDGSLYVCGNEHSNNTGFGQGFLYRLNPATGMPIWYKIFEQPGSNGMQIHSMTFDSLGHVITVGASNEGSDYRRAKVIQWNCNDGAEQWRRDYNRGPSDDYFGLIKVDSANNIVIAGRTSTQANNSALDVAKLDSSVVRFSPAGGLLDVTHFDRASLRDDSFALLIDPLDNIYVGGTSGGVGTGLDALVLKYRGSNDTTTTTPLLTQPANNTVAAHSLAVAFSLPESALADSVKLTFDDGTAPRDLTLATSQGTSGAHAFTFDPASPLLVPEIAAGTPLPDGVYAVRVSYRDSLGNPAASSAAVTGIVLDTTGPAGGTFAFSPANPVSAATNVMLEASGWADAQGPLTYQFFLGATPLGAAGASASFAMAPLPAGPHIVSARIFDSLGNFTDAAPLVVVVDGTAPVITTPGPLTREAMAPHGTTVFFSVSATDDFDPNPSVLSAPASGSLFPLGTTTVNVTAQDAAGNTSAETFTVTMRDTTAPVFPVLDNIIVAATGAAGTVVNFTVTATDAVDASPSIVTSHASGSTFPVGGTLVIASATDDSGNTRTNQFVVTVQDRTPPVLNLPANIIAEATSPAGAIVNYGVTATDEIDPSPSVSVTLPSGSTFPIGIRSVTVVAVDDSSNSTFGSFTVTVRDTTPPTIGGAFAPLTIGPGALLPNYAVQAVTSDAVGVINISQWPPSFTPVPAGGVLVTLTAHDAAGNSASTSFNVTAGDTTPPVLTLPPNDVFEATSAAGAVVHFSPTAVDDFDATPTVTASPASGSTFPLGTTTVTVTATDDAGNSASGTFTVTVSDTIDPELGDIVYSPKSITEGTPLPDYAAQATATDAVGVTSITQTPAPGTATSVGSVTVQVVARDAAGNGQKALFIVTVTAASATPVSTLRYAKGDAVPGEPTGTTFTSFGVPALNDTGAVAFIATMRKPDGRSATGLFDGTRIVIRSYEPVPGGGFIRSFKDPAINSAGAMAFHATLEGGGVTTQDNAALITNSGGVMRKVARRGDAAPGVPSGQFATFHSFALTETGAVVFTATLFRGVGSISTANDSTLWIWTPADGTRLLLREGQAFDVNPLNPGSPKTVASFDALEIVSGSFGHGRGAVGNTVFARVVIRDGAKTIGKGIYAFAADGSVELINNTFGMIPPFAFREMYVPSPNRHGLVAMIGQTQSGKSYRNGIFAEELVPGTVPGVLVPFFHSIAMQDDTADAATKTVFRSFKDPVHNAGGGVAFLGSVSGSSVTNANDNGLWWTGNGNNAPPVEVAREGSEVAGVSGARWRTVTSVALPDSLGPVFTASLATGQGGVTAANDNGLWSVDSLGVTHLLVREGDILRGKPVISLTSLSNVSGSPGQTRSFNARKEVVYRAILADGSHVIVTVRIP